MKKTKFFIAAGAITLGITSIFGTKPNKKFNTFNTAYASNEVTVIKQGAHLFNTVITGGYSTARFTTANGTSLTLVTSNGSGFKAYYK